MEQISVLYRLVLTVTCLVCLGFSGGMCSEFDPLIKTYVSSSLPSKSNDGLVYSRKLKDEVHSITESEWESLVIQSELPVMVMFTARWCGPCRDMIPILNKMDSEYKNEFKFYTVNFDTEIRLTERFDISYLPTTLVFKGGEQMAKVKGADPKKLRELVKKYI
ncbi:Thioredoxin-like superfamily [Arabidopsis thaliana x Arabidopsis arenosa]|uniref:Thioredoxin domain-containing protein n=2 Tax=Arabidopsis TaxID=3701 RepID=A0A178WC18_ARATH|nr:Thioredoxin-like superfamily [Arabidopsis thaliana x Arabidopsis arenosa]OAP15736.1 hypothetical protein AXX17_AT1G47280 [Arabidopsis thaliana]